MKTAQGKHKEDQTIFLTQIDSNGGFTPGFGLALHAPLYCSHLFINPKSYHNNNNKKILQIFSTGTQFH
jgi:hypothetical protein